MEERRKGQEQQQALVMRTVASHSCLPVLSEDQVLYVLVEISPHPARWAERLPLNLCMVLDRSTSMQGARLQRVKDATHLLIDFFDPSDVFGLVTFSDRAEVVIASHPNVDKAYAKARVSTIHSAGGTEILKGLVAGLHEVDRWRAPGMVNHLILLTDGQTYGGEQECLAQAEAAAGRQISISTMGIGQDWNDKLLDEIAARSGGTSTYIDSATKVSSVFRERIRSLAAVAAQSMQLSVRLPDGVYLQEVFRVSPQLERLVLRRGSIQLGQLDREQPCVLIFELLLSRGLSGTMYVAQLGLRADVSVAAGVPTVANIAGSGADSLAAEPSEDGSTSVELQANVEIELAGDAFTGDSVPPNIVSALGKLAIFKMQEKTMEDLDRGEIEQASQRLETMATRLLNIGENELAKAALLEAGRLTRSGHLSPEGRKKIRYGTRGLSMLPKEISHG
jgi:Ca-activated chloride channel family protein